MGYGKRVVSLRLSATLSLGGVPEYRKVCEWPPTTRLRPEKVERYAGVQRRLVRFWDPKWFQ
jgi:hypothetical protein